MNSHCPGRDGKRLTGGLGRVALEDIADNFALARRQPVQTPPDQFGLSGRACFEHPGEAGPMLSHQGGDERRDPGQTPEFGLGEYLFLAHQGQHDMRIAGHMREEADLFCDLGPHVIGAEIFALIEPVGRQVAQSIQARRHRTDRRKEKRIQQVGSLDIVGDEHLASGIREIVMNLQRATIAPVTEHDRKRVGYDLTQPRRQRAAEVGRSQRGDCRSQRFDRVHSGMPGVHHGPNYAFCGIYGPAAIFYDFDRVRV